MESIIRPPSLQTDKEMPDADLRCVQEIGKLGVELTGYVLFSYRKLNDDIYVAYGDFETWVYEQLGLLVFCDELWDVRARGGKDYVELSEMNKERDFEGLEEVYSDSRYSYGLVESSRAYKRRSFITTGL